MKPTKNDLDLIKKIWINFLTKGFDPQTERLQIYLEIPFCVYKCRFCIYNSTTLKNKNQLDDYLDNILLKNIEQFADVLSLRTANSLYLGGGSASILSVDRMAKVINTLKKHTDFDSIKYKHYEFNPVLFNDEKLAFLKENNFTYFSFGVQTLNQEVLAFNNRRNVSVEQLAKIIAKVNQAGIASNIDLLLMIYHDDIDEDLEIFAKDLTIIKKLQPTTITIYPNYRPFNDIDNQQQYLERLLRLIKIRLLILDQAEDQDYFLPDKKYFGELDLINIHSNLLRIDLLHRGQENFIKEKLCYRSAQPKNLFDRSISTLAFGGLNHKRPHSYIRQDQLIYFNKVLDGNLQQELASVDYCYLE